MTDKRRFTDLLPSVFQTDNNKRWAASTVDVLIQPGSAEQISGYIGQHTSYADPLKDFYINEPTQQRSTQQLVPMMISRDATGTINTLFGYDDLINYLRESGAIVSDENRLFTDVSYAWAPPIDLDKILNCQQYLWFGDHPSAQPTITLRPQRTSLVCDGVTATYTLPPVQGGVDPSRETPLVLADGAPLAITRSGDQITLLVVPAAGVALEIFRYSDLRPVLEGNVTFDVSPWLTADIGVTKLTSNMRLLLDDGLGENYGWDLLGFDAVAQLRPYGCPTYIPDPWDSYLLRSTSLFFVEGVGTNIVLIPTSDDVTAYTAPMYVTIDRRSRDRNDWSATNYWVHRDAVAFSGQDFHARRALRPIIEYKPNLELFNYGWTRLPNIHAVLTGDAYYLPSALGVQEPVNVNNYNGTVQVRLTETNGQPVGHIVVDAGHRLRNGDRFIVRNSSDTTINDCIIETVLAVPSDLNQDDVLTFRIATRPKIGDIVRLDPRGFIPWDLLRDSMLYDRQPWDYGFSPVDYHYTAEGWKISGNADPLQDPLFALYTEDGTAHEALPLSNFEGNRLFGFTAGSGAPDKYTLRPLAYEENDGNTGTAEISFTNDQFSVRATSDGSAITGYQYYRVINDGAALDTYENGWFPTDDISLQVLSNGLFSLPDNLFKNPDMEEVGETSRGRFFDHFTALMRRQPGFSGSPYQRNNWRDTTKLPSAAYTGPAWAPKTAYKAGDVVVAGFLTYRCTTAHTSGQTFSTDNWESRPQTFITQPRSPLLKTMLLAADRRFDYQDAVRYVDSEYQRFRNKFYAKITETYESGTRVEADTDDQWVDTILQALRIAKTADFPFALSPMCGGGFFIPPTAAAMGLLPVVRPGYEVDDQISAAYVDVRGHDGSRTPYAPGLYARIMLALEWRIYNNILAKFKTEAKPYFDFDNLIESRANAGQTGNETTTLPNPCDSTQAPVQTNSRLYSPLEVTRVLTPTFLRWVQLNNYDYRSNTTYDHSNPFTWNYRGYKDKDGYAQRGHTHAIYRWFFDTERPHTSPWHMLGFADMPLWWTDEYGAAPYTAGNHHLWTDLRDGRIRRGVRAGIDARYARPDLLSILPVDDDGNLRDPVTAGIMPTKPTDADAARDWEFGDEGPIEYIWINSASYPFARSLLGYLLRPAEWTEIGWDTLDYGVRPDGQWRYDTSHDRPRSALLAVHGEINPLTNRRIAITGLQQWISDMMVSRNQRPALLGSAVRGIQVRLCHKMAAFTQKKSLRVFADNFGILPHEDTEVVLHTSPPLREAVYSGVIVEWNGSGWTVVGYDSEKNGFCTIPGKPTGGTQVIALGDDPQIYEWVSRREYPMNTLVEYQGTVYRAIQQHTSGLTFDKSQWSPSSITLKRYPKATVYTTPDTGYEFVPYGTLFTTVQEVAEFLWDYGRSQVADGFVFDSIDPATGQVIDWEFMIRQFLAWAQTDWQPGQFIALSPGASSLKFVTPHGVVFNLEETVNGLYGLIDRTGRPIAKRSTFVSRIDDTTVIQTSTENLFGARLRIGEIEHALVFSNLTIFGDVVYRPLYALAQPRLRLIGLRSRNWTGRLDAPGYIVNGPDLMADFDRASENLRTMFEIEGSEDADLRDHARHVIGYQTRPYLQNLLISDTQQFEFYQGMIQAKGSPGVFDKLTRSKIIDDDVDLAFLEEWGFQVGQFGALESRQTLSFRLDQADLRANPQFVFFGPNDPYDAIVSVPSGDAKWIHEPADVGHAFLTAPPPPPYKGGGSPLTNPRQPALPTAGPVRLDEIDVACFSPDFFEQLYNDAKAYNPIRDGWTVHVYDMLTAGRGWDVLRAYLLGANGSQTCKLLAVTTAAEDPLLDYGIVRLTFTEPHGLSDGDNGLYMVVGGTTGATPEVEGFGQIGIVESSTTVLVNLYATAGVDMTGNANISAFVMRSQRFSTLAARNAFYARYPMVAGQYCYVDQNDDLS